MLKDGGSEWVLEKKKDGCRRNKQVPRHSKPKALESRGWWGSDHKREVEGRGREHGSAGSDHVGSYILISHLLLFFTECVTLILSVCLFIY